jgi:hypothetical protein
MLSQFTNFDLFVNKFLDKRLRTALPNMLQGCLVLNHNSSICYRLYGELYFNHFSSILD